MIVALYAVGEAAALDYDPPPTVKTMEWTMIGANLSGKWVFEDATAESILARLDSSGQMPGAYFSIDRSQVRPKLETRLSIRAENLSWLQVLARVADAVGSDIVISPGHFTLVPRVK